MAEQEAPFEDSNPLAGLMDVLPDLPADDLLFEEEDGEIYVRDPEDTKGAIDDAEWGANLAEFLSPEQRKEIAMRYNDYIDKDIKDRKRRDDKLAEALKRTGFGKDAPGGADFEGASRVTHPLIGEATIDFAARERKELLPPNGPVKTFIDGQASQERLKRANRKAAFMNRQLMRKSKSFRTEMGKMISQLPLGGSEYMKVCGWNYATNCPDFEYIPIEDFFLPSACSGFMTAHRRTHRQKLTDITFKQRVASGLYIDLEGYDDETITDQNPLLKQPTVSMPNETSVEIVRDEIQGVEPSSDNQDGLRIVFETSAIDEFEAYDPACAGCCPYILHIDKEKQDLIGMYRNWDELDTEYQELDWVVDFGFIKWEGPYDIGLPHLIGGLAVALTGGLRALMDSALIQTSPTALKLSNNRVSGQAIPINIAQINQIDAGQGIDDIRKVAMPLPLNGPSPVLLQLLTIIHDLGRGVIRTALDDVPTEAPETPVGTQLSRVEQALVVYSDIHAGLHHSMDRLLAIVHRLNGEYLPDEVKTEDGSDMLVLREDFIRGMDIAPVSDPRIFSELQRYQQAQFMLGLADKYPDQFNRSKLIRDIMDAGNIKVGADAFTGDMDPQYLTPVEENLRMVRGEAVEPPEDQDQLMHIHVLSTFMKSPVWGLNPVIAVRYLPLAMQNISKRIVYWQTNRMNQIAEQAMGEKLNMADSHSHRVNSSVEPATIGAAVLSGKVAEEAMKVFADVLPVMQQAQQLLQQLAPKDPSIRVAESEVQRQAARDQKSAAAKDKELQIEQQRDQMEHVDRVGNTQEKRAGSLDRLEESLQDNKTSKEIVAAEIAANLKVPAQRHGLA